MGVLLVVCGAVQILRLAVITSKEKYSVACNYDDAVCSKFLQVDKYMKPKDEVFQLRLDRETREKFERVARHKGQTMAGYVRTRINRDYARLPKDAK